MTEFPGKEGARSACSTSGKGLSVPGPGVSAPGLSGSCFFQEVGRSVHPEMQSVSRLALPVPIMFDDKSNSVVSLWEAYYQVHWHDCGKRWGKCKLLRQIIISI